jgi:hypothetical protein
MLLLLLFPRPAAQAHGCDRHRRRRPTGQDEPAADAPLPVSIRGGHHRQDR